MKVFELKKDGDLDYKKFLLNLLKTAPTNGYSVDDVFKSMKAIEVLEETKKKKADFEDDVWNFVKKRVLETKYRGATKELVTFLKEFK